MFIRRVLSAVSSSRSLVNANPVLLLTRGCSTSSGPKPEVDAPKDKKMSKAMRAYVERSKAYSEFIKKEENEFNIGKRHLANMMGVNPETFTQDQINEAIEYLFPSGLFEKKARPFMKPPELVFPPKKDAEFDESGRPFNYLFYTGKPNFYNLLNEMALTFKQLDKYEDEFLRKGGEPPKTLDLLGSKWLSKEDLENRLVEQLSDAEYKNYLITLDRLASHPFSSQVKPFIFSQRSFLMESSMKFDPETPSIDVDGRSYITTRDCPRKSARADVTVRSPGTGQISINGKGIEYFTTNQARYQILFPLELTGLRDSVDIEATVKGGGETGQAGAVRWGISWGLRCFVPPDMLETMRLAGLLTRDFRARERKKPGQAKARRKFTWKKR